MTYSKLDKYARIALTEVQGQTSQRRDNIRMDLLCEMENIPPDHIPEEGTKNTLHSLRMQNALVKENRLELIGDASMELGSLVFMEMIGFWNNRGQMVVFTIRVKVDITTIMGQSGIQGALTCVALWPWLIGHRARKMDNQPGCYFTCMTKTFISEGSEPSVTLPT